MSTRSKRAVEHDLSRLRALFVELFNDTPARDFVADPLHSSLVCEMAELLGLEVTDRLVVCDRSRFEPNS
jgi:hypothetical protein